MYESMASQREIYASYRSKICMPHISSLQRLFSFMGTFFVAKDRIDNSPAAAGSFGFRKKTFWLHLPILYVYLLLSFEEVVRLMIAAVLFRRKKWMQSLA